MYMQSVLDKHSFHLVDQSPWPLIGSISVMSLLLNLYLMINISYSLLWICCATLSFLMVLFQWMRDIVRESTFQGNHCEQVCSGLYVGILMFILSELLFFFSFFFSFFSVALCPDVEIGMKWPPTGIEPLEFYLIPLVNTLLLLSSGVSITWSHECVLSSSRSQAIVSTVSTMAMGGLFVLLQYEEYKESSFTMCDSVYGSIFFIATGFHGIHVIVGIMMIMVSLVRMVEFHFSKSHHLGFEVASWYWHFVDVVWMFLFLSMYWWGS